MDGPPRNTIKPFFLFIFQLSGRISSFCAEKYSWWAYFNNTSGLNISKLDLWTPVGKSFFKSHFSDSNSNDSLSVFDSSNNQAPKHSIGFLGELPL